MVDDNSIERAACMCASLRKVTRSVTRAYDAHLKSSGLRIGQYSLLANIARNPGVAVSDLAELLVMDQTTVTRNLQLLRKAGHIEVTSSMEDRRVKVVTLSTLGKRTLHQAYPLWERAQADLKARMGASGYDGLLQALLAAMDRASPR